MEEKNLQNIFAKSYRTKNEFQYGDKTQHIFINGILFIQFFQTLYEHKSYEVQLYKIGMQDEVTLGRKQRLQYNKTRTCK